MNMEKTENLQNLWVDLKTIAELKQITTRALRISLQKDKYVFRDVTTQGGVAAKVGSSGANIVGYAYDGAAAAGALIRVKLAAPSYAFA